MHVCLLGSAMPADLGEESSYKLQIYKSEMSPSSGRTYYIFASLCRV